MSKSKKMNRTEKINRFNEMDERVSKQMFNEKLSNLIKFLEYDDSKTKTVTVTKRSQFGVFIAKYLSEHLPDDLKKLVSKRGDLFAEASQQAKEKFSNDKRMIDSCSMNLYGMKIFNEFESYHNDNTKIKERLLNLLNQ